MTLYQMGEDDLSRWPVDKEEHPRQATKATEAPSFSATNVRYRGSSGRLKELKGQLADLEEEGNGQSGKMKDLYPDLISSKS